MAVEEEPGPGPQTERATSGTAALYAGLGVQFAAAVVVFAYAGIWLDRRFGTSPLFILLGVFLGAGGAFYSMIRRIKEGAQHKQPKDNGRTR